MPNPTPSHAGDARLVALGAAIKGLRSEKGLSQEALAVDSGVERAYLSGIERGRQNSTVVTLMRIAQALDVKLGAILLAADI